MKKLFHCIAMLFMLLLLNEASLLSQTTKTIEAEGSWKMQGDITKNQAKEKAVTEAKKNALEKAGEDVGFLPLLATFGDQQQFSEEFSKLTDIATDGIVRLLKEPEYFEVASGINDSPLIKAKIKAEVSVDNPSDSEFVISVMNFKTSYRNYDELLFSVELSKDAHVHVFWFNNTIEGNGYVLYPHPDFDKDTLLPKGRHDFPVNKTLAYTIDKKTNENSEKNLIFIIATKHQIPFVDEVNYHNFFKWYRNIAGDERSNIEYRGFIIY